MGPFRIGTQRIYTLCYSFEEERRGEERRGKSEMNGGGRR